MELMFTSSSLSLMHQLVGYLLEPVVWLLLALVALCVLDIGTLLSERFFALRHWRVRGTHADFERLAIKRIERADFLTRIAPMLGLMGTLIPLGPGLAALGAGDLDVLTTAMSVAFDTTVLGLLVGVAGFVVGRLRRRWYSDTLEAIESRERTAIAQPVNGIV